MWPSWQESQRTCRRPNATREWGPCSSSEAIPPGGSSASGFPGRGYSVLPGALGQSCMTTTAMHPFNGRPAHEILSKWPRKKHHTTRKELESCSRLCLGLEWTWKQTTLPRETPWLQVHPTILIWVKKRMNQPNSTLKQIPSAQYHPALKLTKAQILEDSNKSTR